MIKNPELVNGYLVSVSLFLFFFHSLTRSGPKGKNVVKKEGKDRKKRATRKVGGISSGRYALRYALILNHIPRPTIFFLFFLFLSYRSFSFILSRFSLPLGEDSGRM